MLLSQEHYGPVETLGVRQQVRIADLPEDSTWPKHEIIDGTLIVTPYAGLPHQAAVGRLHLALAGAAPDGVVVYPGANVRRVADGGESLLIPDVVVARADTTDPTYLAPEDVLVAVEVVSPGSRTMDLVTKRATYAAWGIPAYLVLDLAAPAGEGLTWHGDTSAVAWAVAAVQG